MFVNMKLNIMFFFNFPATPRTGSRQGSRAGSRTGLRPNQPGTGSEGSKAQQGSGGSWMLEHVTEVVYLATQIQITEQMENCMKSVADGNKDAIQVGCMWWICGVHVMYMWCACDRHVIYIWWTCDWGGLLWTQRYRSQKRWRTVWYLLRNKYAIPVCYMWWTSPREKRFLLKTKHVMQDHTSTFMDNKEVLILPMVDYCRYHTDKVPHFV